MGNHIRIVFRPTLYIIPVNHYKKFIRLSELAHAAWSLKCDSQSHFHCIWSNEISCWENVCLGKRDWCSTLQAESIRTSLQRLEIGSLSVSANESCVCWVDIIGVRFKWKLTFEAHVPSVVSSFSMRNMLSWRWWGTFLHALLCCCIATHVILFWSPYLVVPGQDASSPKSGGICTKWIRSISPTQIWVWLLRNSGF